MMRRHRHAGRTTRRRGVALLEFSMLMPIMFLFLLLILDTGRALLIRSVTQDAAFAAARSISDVGALTAGDRDVFTQAVAQMPIAGDITVVYFRSGMGPAGISAGGASANRCSIANPYVYVKTIVTVPLFTPMLGYVLGSGQSGWAISSSAVARCAVAR